VHELTTSASEGEELSESEFSDFERLYEMLRTGDEDSDS